MTSNHEHRVTTEEYDTMSDHNTCRIRPRWSVLLLSAAFLGGCDTSVTNPGPVQDSFLDSIIAQVAVVLGSSRDLSDELDQIA